MFDAYCVCCLFVSVFVDVRLLMSRFEISDCASVRSTALKSGAGEGIRTPDLLITNQLLYRPELRQPDKEQIIALPVPAEQALPAVRDRRLNAISTVSKPAPCVKQAALAVAEPLQTV